MPYVDSVEEYHKKLEERLINAPKSGRGFPRYLKNKVAQKEDCKIIK